MNAKQLPLSTLSRYMLAFKEKKNHNIIARMEIQCSCRHPSFTPVRMSCVANTCLTHPHALPNPPPHVCPDSAANPQRPQGLGVRAGLRPGAAHAAERLPRRHAEGVERGQLHPHRRGQRSRQPHQRHLHQLQADLHRVQVKGGGHPVGLWRGDEAWSAVTVWNFVSGSRRGSSLRFGCREPAPTLFVFHFNF